MDTNLFSIIIPVYNVERYLNKCIESVVKQTYKNFEIILVDDGSPDSCPRICDEWAKKDDRIVVIHKGNGGLSSARNAGIKRAKGQYIGFIDSDDYWIENNFLEKIKDIVTENSVDVILFEYKEVDESGNTIKTPQFKCQQSIKADLKKVVDEDCLYSSACHKFVKQELFSNNDLFFREGVTSEDIEWTAKLISVAKEYYIYPIVQYAYVQRKGSVVHSIDINAIKILKENISLCIDIAKKTDDNIILGYVSYQYITLLNLYVRFGNNDESIYDFIKNNSWLLSYSKNKKTRIIQLFHKLFGMKITLFLLKLFLTIK